MKLNTKSSSRLWSACTFSLKWSEVGKSQHKIFGLTVKRAFNSLGMNWRCQSVFNKGLWNTMQRAVIFSRGRKNSFLQALLQCQTLLQHFITLCGVIFKKGPVQQVTALTLLDLILVLYYFISCNKCNNSCGESRISAWRYFKCDLVK